MKNSNVLPPNTAPYLILLCLAKSSALSMLASIRSIVRKAAKLAVYEEMTIKAKNHHNPAVSRVEIALCEGDFVINSAKYFFVTLTLVEYHNLAA